MKNIDMIKNMEVWELRQKFLAELPDNTNLGEWLEQEAEKPSIFEPKEGETYYSVNYAGRITEFENINLSADEGLIAFGNVCTDKPVMERKAHDLKLWSLLWNFAEENNDEIDWDDADEWKYYIYFNHNAQIIKLNMPVFNLPEYPFYCI